jgi:hypothetical protein
MVDPDAPRDVLDPDVAERLLISAHFAVEPTAAPPVWAVRAADIGLRAEHYSLYMERSEHLRDSSCILPLNLIVLGTTSRTAVLNPQL